MLCEFYASGTADDEYVAIVNRCDETIDLNGWALTDGEGTLTFGEGARIRPEERQSVSFNSSSYMSAFGRPPDYCVTPEAGSASVDLCGVFRLANSGDSIALLSSDGVLVDFVLYGDSQEASDAWAGPALPAPRRGEVIRRVVHMEDTDTAADWQHFREFRYGYTEYPPLRSTVEPGNITAFVSPDCSLDAVLDMIASAEESLMLCAYEIDSPRIFKALSDSLTRGVDVRLLIEGAPAGGISQKEVAVLSRLVDAGANVTVLSGNLADGVVKHISAMHSKYIVIDSDGLVVLSENFVEDGLPVDRVFGNRGWGIAIRSHEIAEYMSLVFAEDARAGRPDAIDWRLDERFDDALEVEEQPDSRHSEGIMRPFVSTLPAEVTLCLSPDSSIITPYLCEVIHSSSSLSVEMFQADLFWKTRWSDHECLSPLLGGIIERMRSGGSCRMLLDSTWFNLESNVEVADALTTVAVGESADGVFQLMSERSPVTVVHNKGMLADDEVAIVSSNNWVYASFAKNRELAAIVRSAEVTKYLRSAFELDWYPDVMAPIVQVPREVAVSFGEWVELSAGSCSDDRLVVGYAWDIGSDGTIDGDQCDLRFLATAPGTMEVALTVTDGWGNEATAVVVVRVAGPSMPSWSTEYDPWWTGVVVVPGAAALAFGGLRLLARRRARGSE